MLSNWRFRAVVTALFVALPASVMAQVTIQSITSSQQSGTDVVRIELSEALPGVPAGFTIQAPPRIAIDLPGVANGLGKSSIDVNQGNLRSVRVAQSGERTRLVLNLKKSATYRAEVQGKVLLLVLDAGAPPAVEAADAAVPAASAPLHFAQKKFRGFDAHEVFQLLAGKLRQPNLEIRLRSSR